MSVTSFEMRCRVRRWVLTLAWSAFLIGFLNTATGFWALKRLEKKAGSPVKGKFLPHFFEPAFMVKDLKISWQNRFEVISGAVRVRYDPLSVLTGKKFRVQIRGSDLKVRFLEGLAFATARASVVRITSVTADFALSEAKTPEIFALEVHSPELEFHFSEKDRRVEKFSA